MKSKIWLFGLALCLVCSFTACKSKQSAYKAAYEKAKEKEPEETIVVVEETVPVSKPSTGIQATVKKEKITPVAGTGLKRYSVVIGSFQNKTNALSLKERMEGDGFNVILAQNEAGMYRVIVASYDSKDDAAAKRDQIKMKYAPAFEDAWLLEQQY